MSTGPRKTSFARIPAGVALALATTFSIQAVPVLTWVDIGSPSPPGSQAYDAEDDAYAITVGGADMWDGFDEFSFGHESAAGDGELVVKVDSISGPSVWSRVGISFRASLAAHTAHVTLIATPGKGVDMQWRSVAGGTSNNHPGTGTQNPTPVYLKLVRTGDSFSGYRSEDGEIWTLVRTQTVDLPDTAQAGLIACAVNLFFSGQSVNATVSGYTSTYAIPPGPTVPQIITFPSLPDAGRDIVAVPLAATASSGLPVSYEVFSGPAQFVGDLLKLTGEGTVTIRATQPGNASFLPAAPVDRSFESLPARMRILCIGDSFTQGGPLDGGGVSPGYRDPFIRLLHGNTIEGANPGGLDYSPLVDLIGSQTAGYLGVPQPGDYPDSLALDPEHEGHSGWTADDILVGSPFEPPEAGKLSDWLAGYSYLPNVVLLHIGTNDSLHQRNEDVYDLVAGEFVAFFAANIRDEIGGIIDTLRLAQPSVKIFVAKIPPSNFWPTDEGNAWRARTNAINAILDGLAAEKNTVAAADYVHIVDNFAGFDATTMLDPDGLHPNAAGLDFIAGNFFDAIQWLLDGELSPPAPPAYTGPPRILCLGDSITQGGAGQHSYRLPLLQLLGGDDIGGANPTGTTYETRFIGTMSTGFDFIPGTESYPEPLFSNPMHEGHAVHTAGDLLDRNTDIPVSEGPGRLQDWLLGYTPDIVLLHIGSYDARSSVTSGTGLPSADTTRDNIGRIIDTLRAANPEVVIFLARLIDGADWWGAAVDPINDRIDALAAAKNAAAAAPYVFVVDHHTGFDRTTMLAGDIHPNVTGAEFMAVNWFNALAPYLDSLALTPIEVWRLTHFGVTADSGDGADDNDFDGDGLANLLEYALGLDPRSPSASPLVTEVIGDYLTITVAKNPAATDVTFSAESGGAPGSLSETSTVTLLDDDTTFQARDNVLLSTTTARFIRIRVGRE